MTPSSSLRFPCWARWQAATSPTARQSPLLSYRLEQLERKVEKHNSVVERTFQLENNVQTAFSRIDEIREALHEHQET